MLCRNAVTDLTKKRERERLPARPDPYWQRLYKGAYLGFLRGPDTWRARYRGRDKKQQFKPLGEAIDYDEAKRRAEAWLEQISGSTVRTVKRGTVREALADYLADLRRHGRADAAAEAGWRFKTTLYKDPDAPSEKDDPLADVELESATQDDFQDWRDRLMAGRQARTVNRYVRAAVAGLNRAVELGHIGNPATWTLKELADDVSEEGDTAVFLSAEQRAGLIAAASPETAAFLRGLELSGARPKELANANVGDFDGESLRLAHKKGRPPKLRMRRTVLSEDGVAFFAKQARDKLPGAPLFTEDGKQRWRRAESSPCRGPPCFAPRSPLALADTRRDAASAASRPR